MSDVIVIDLNPLLANLPLIGYGLVKFIFAIVFYKAELRNPLWKNGAKVERQPHEKCRVFLRHLIFNPEWATLKALVFIPVFLWSGTEHASKFKPWHVPPRCTDCKDTGVITSKGFLSNTTNVSQCHCRRGASNV